MFSIVITYEKQIFVFLRTTQYNVDPRINPGKYDHPYQVEDLNPDG
jgi:hypothetical protein